MTINCTIKGYDFIFKTCDACFSPEHIDNGTLAMLSCVDFKKDDKIIDLGCGYGVVGIVAAKFTLPANVFLLDINKEALKCTEENAMLNNTNSVNIIESNAYENLNEKGFDLILSNPPYHVDFSVPKAFIEKGFNRLKTGGRMLLVTKRKDWYFNKMKSIFGGVRVQERNGYFVFESEKRSNTYSKR